jgi:hypothetical protein
MLLPILTGATEGFASAARSVSKYVQDLDVKHGAWGNKLIIISSLHTIHSTGLTAPTPGFIAYTNIQSIINQSINPPNPDDLIASDKSMIASPFSGVVPSTC